VALSGTEKRHAVYEVAVGTNYSWQEHNTAQTIPRNAAVVGFNANREETFACRANLSTNLIPGKVDIRRCFVPYLGREFLYDDYEILLNEI
jgi:hypothetical protein